jgi:hypothetical protein
MGETHVGGQAKYVLEVAKNLALRDWQISIYTIGGRGAPGHVQVSQGCELIRMERANQRPYNYDIDASEAHQIGESILIEALDRDVSFDLIYACFWISGLAAHPIASFLNISVMFSFCQLGAFKAQSDGVAAVSERILHERAICQRARGIIATNRDEVACIRNEYGVPRHKIHFIPRGIDLQMFFA